jgi:hypothetical protein
MPTDEMTVIKMILAKMSADEITVGQITVAKT